MKHSRLADAADLALLGILAFVAALPLLTLGAAAAAASAAARDLAADGSLPPWRVTARRFTAGLVPGAAASLVAVAVGVALVLDLRGIAAGAVPGGVPVYVATLGIALFLAGLGGVTVAEVGCGSGWSAGLTAAWRQPGRSTTAAGIVAAAAILAWAVPVTLPIVGAVALYALHVTRIRTRHHLEVRR